MYSPVATASLATLIGVFPLKDENPVYRKPYATWILIAINILIFFGPQSANNPESGGSNFILEYAAIPCEIKSGEPLTGDEVIATFEDGDSTACGVDLPGTGGNEEVFPDKFVWVAMLFSMFFHGDLMHLGGNMLFLWIFGNNIEDRLGHVKYVIFYLLGGFAATIAHVFVQVDSTIPVVGASGAIAAVMGAYAVWYPEAPVRTIIFVMLKDIKAKWMLGIWFVMQFFTGAGSGVAWMAHVGGFIFGALVGLAIRQSRAAQAALFTPEYARNDGWDNTGGIGRGPYAEAIPIGDLRRRQ